MKRLVEILNPLFFLKVIKADPAKAAKRGLFCFILIPFFFIHFQQLMLYVSLKPLKGYFIPKVYTPVTNESWFSGEYQRSTDDYVNEGFGFRNIFVRINNQLRFWFFNTAQAEGIIVGKENYLYETDYIETYFGKSFLGEAALNDTINNLKFLQDTLKSMGKELLVVMAPSKARVYPEYIPDYLVKQGKINTNYEFLSIALKSARVHFIDFNSLFIEKKKTSKQLLFPQLGVHWSRLEAVKAVDSIISYLGNISNTALPRVKIKEITELDTLQAPDNDIIEGMNVLFFPEHKKMEYPTIIEIDKKSKAKRNLIVVSDSYWWDIYSRDIPKNVFENNEFWYYNNELFGNNYIGKTDPKKIDMKRHILKSDYIVLLCTETNLNRIGFGFVGNAIQALRKNIVPTSQELDDIIAVIKTNKEWYTQIQTKAGNQKIGADSMLKLDAEWYFQRRGPQKQEISLVEVRALISINDSWMKEITAKANERKISVDSMMTIDALWYIENVLKTSVTKQKVKLTLPSVKEMISHNNEWMAEIRKKAQKRNLSVDSMMTLDAMWYINENKK